MSGYKFDNKVVQWVDDRLPLFTVLRHSTSDYPTPRNLNYWWNFGSLAAVMLIMSLAVFALMAAMPGDPIDLMIAGNPHLTADDANRLRALYGVGQPWPVRWWDWLGQVIHGQLGYSRLFARPVAQMIWPALVTTSGLISNRLMSLATKAA